MGQSYIPASGGGMTIGSPVVGASPNDVLFVDEFGNLADNETFYYDVATETLRIGSSYAIIAFPDGSIQSDDEQVLSFTNFLRLIFNGAKLSDLEVYAQKLGLINSGADTSIGFAQMTAGTFSILNSLVSNATTQILISPHTSSGNIGSWSVVIDDGIGFTVNSSNPLDDSYISFVVLYKSEP